MTVIEHLSSNCSQWVDELEVYVYDKVQSGKVGEMRVVCIEGLGLSCLVYSCTRRAEVHSV